MRSSTTQRHNVEDSWGVGTLIAVSFMILIVISAFGIYLVIFNQMGSFQESVERMNRVDWERSQENVYLSKSLSSIIDESGTYRFNLTVVNAGYLEAHLVYFGVFNDTADVYNYDPVEPSISISPGSIRYNVTSSFTFTGDRGYIIHLVTDRGNIAQVLYLGEGEFGDIGDIGGEDEGSEGFGLPNNLQLHMTVDTPYFQGTQNPGTDTFRIYALNLHAENNISNILFNITKKELEGNWDSYTVTNITFHWNDLRRGGEGSFPLTGVDWENDDYVVWNITEYNEDFKDLMPKETWYVALEFQFNSPSSGVTLYQLSAESPTPNTIINIAYVTISVKPK